MRTNTLIFLRPLKSLRLCQFMLHLSSFAIRLLFWVHTTAMHWRVNVFLGLRRSRIKRRLSLESFRLRHSQIILISLFLLRNINITHHMLKFLSLAWILVARIKIWSLYIWFLLHFPKTRTLIYLGLVFT